MKKKYDKVKPRVYDIKQPSIRYEKYRKKENLDGVTLKPILNYTINSKTAKNMEKKRNHHFKTIIPSFLVFVLWCCHLFHKKINEKDDIIRVVTY